jgi:2-dehydro-3-deoxyphosphogalactonate aldolase
MGMDGLAALRAVLPAQTEVYMVGDVGPDSFGTSLYRPGDSAKDVSAKARIMVAAYDEVSA